MKSQKSQKKKIPKKISYTLLLNWLDNNLLLLLSCFLLVFTPLYPKIPLAELIPGYIVRMRLEDVFVLLTAFVWAIQVLRKKVKYFSTVHLFIGLYLFFSALSILSAVLLLKSIPFETLHIGKSVLHWIRYLEYFMLFAITFSATKSVDEVKKMFGVMVFTLIGVTIYGYGQKFHYWPVFSTMNREFSKGIRLYLTEHARVQSTFGGHYDFAAYLVILNTLVLSLALTVKQRVIKIFLHLTHLFGLWMLILTASRVSFIAYYIAIITTIFVLAATRKKRVDKIKYVLGKSLIYTFIIGAMMFSFGQDMRDRLFHVFKDYPQVEQTYLIVQDFTDFSLINIIAFFSSSSAQPNEDWVAVELTDQQIDPVLNKTDQRPTTSKPKPDDVYVDVPDKVKVATKSATGETKYITIERERTWSDNAIKYGLSAAIRLDTLWPNAVRGFISNPLLGSGFATLNKETPTHFTEAESTDNNFLRTLGETGLLGFISFYGILATGIYFSIQLLKTALSDKAINDRNFLIGFNAGYIGVAIGLLLNAVYIDVYASSKVAFTFWALTGLIIALYYQLDLDSGLSSLKKIKQLLPKKRRRHHKKR